MTASELLRFTTRVRQLNGNARQPLHGFFQTGQSISVARAPGRLDVMGGVADYSGALVLQLPIRESALVAAQRTDHDDWQIASLPASDDEPLRSVQLSRKQMIGFADYAAARQWFQQDAAIAWAAYLAGTILVLGQELGTDIDCGLRLLVQSAVPEAKGVSSSAALEVATLRAAAHQWKSTIDGTEAARLCQIAENLVVGAPCGIMDQMTSAVGRADKLLALRCQPADIEGFVTVPESIAFWGIDSGIRHAVSGSDYTSVRTGAFMGYRIIAALAGLDVTATDDDGAVAIDDPNWHGYLANVTPAEFETRFGQQLPVQMFGTEFLDKYSGTCDHVTRVQPDRNYAIRQPTAHPIYEHARVRHFRELLAAATDEATCVELGELMYASHQSYSACGLGAAGTDRLVEMVHEAGPATGLFGAKITGGGSGGTVAVLGRRTSSEAIADIARRYADESGRGGYVFSGSSAGAWNEEVAEFEV